MAMIAEPMWFGSKDRPLCGWFHAPAPGGGPDPNRFAASARAGVVLCPPLGIEATSVYFAFRTLAIQLAEAGFAVMRFDYDGTGDSAGRLLDPDRVSAWRDSLRQAVDLLADNGAQSLILVGMRIGALFGAYEAARRGGVDTMVLWDPCVSGRAFLRAEKTLRMLSVGGEGADQGDGAVRGPGMVYDAETVAELEGLDLTTLGGHWANRLLVLTHPDRPRLSPLARRLDGAVTDWGEATGQAELLHPVYQDTPTTTIDTVVKWLDTVAPDRPISRICLPRGRPEAVLRAPADGPTLRERFVRLGARGLFGIVTEPAYREPTGPTVVFAGEAFTPHIGQTRMWVELAREWAGLGFRVLRWDFSGQADSAAGPGQEAHIIRAPEHLDDMEEVRCSASPDDPSDVVIIGLCSGAYQAVESALANRPRGIAAINPGFLFIPPEEPQDQRRRAREATRPFFERLLKRPLKKLAAWRAEPDPDRWIRSLENGAWPGAVHRELYPGTELLWTVVKWIGIKNPSIKRMEQVAAAGSELLVICGDKEVPEITLGYRRTMRRLEREPHFRLVQLSGLDHTALITDQRQRMTATLTDWLMANFAASTSDLEPERRPVMA